MEVKIEVDEQVWGKFCEMCESVDVDPKKFIQSCILEAVVYVGTLSSRESSRALDEMPEELIGMVDSLMRRSRRSADGSDTGQ